MNISLHHTHVETHMVQHYVLIVMEMQSCYYPLKTHRSQNLSFRPNALVGLLIRTENAIYRL